jgi:hypothetical protein
MKQTRQILVACPGSKVDAYVTMGERNDGSEMKRSEWEVNR